MNEDLLRMKEMRNLSANIRVKEPEVAHKQLLDFDSPQFLEMLMGTMPQSISPERAIRVSAVYSCIKVLAETIMTLPCDLKKIDGDTSTTMVDSPLHRLLAWKPNDLMTAADFWAMQVVSICLEGNSYNYIVRTRRGEVVAILPIRYDEAQLNVLQPGNVLEYRFVVGGQPLVLPASEVLHFKSPMSFDGYQGMSPIQYNASLLNGHIKGRDFNNKILTNDATPRGVLESDEALSDEAYANLKSSWNDAHQGDVNAGKIAILESGLKFKPISMSPTDLEILDSQKYSRSEIAGMFRVPAHMIGDLERSTFNNIQHQTLDFYKSSIAPWLRIFEQRLAFSLLKDSTRQFKFDITEFIRGDFPTEVEAYTKLVEKGILSPNEVRTRLMFNPREGGDEYVSAPQPNQQQQELPDEPEA